MQLRQKHNCASLHAPLKQQIRWHSVLWHFQALPLCTQSLVINARKIMCAWWHILVLPPLSTSLFKLAYGWHSMAIYDYQRLLLQLNPPDQSRYQIPHNWHHFECKKFGYPGTSSILACYTHLIWFSLIEPLTRLVMAALTGHLAPRSKSII